MAICTIPVIVMSVFWGVVALVVPVFVPSGPNKRVIQWCLILTAVCCWLFWATVYASQMNPLIGPSLSNYTLLWVAHQWGDPASGTPVPDPGVTPGPVPVPEPPAQPPPDLPP